MDCTRLQGINYRGFLKRILRIRRSRIDSAMMGTEWSGGWELWRIIFSDGKLFRWRIIRTYMGRSFKSCRVYGVTGIGMMATFVRVRMSWLLTGEILSNPGDLHQGRLWMRFRSRKWLRWWLAMLESQWGFSAIWSYLLTWLRGLRVRRSV